MKYLELKNQIGGIGECSFFFKDEENAKKVMNEENNCTLEDWKKFDLKILINAGATIKMLIDKGYKSEDFKKAYSLTVPNLELLINAGAKMEMLIKIGYTFQHIKQVSPLPDLNKAVIKDVPIPDLIKAGFTIIDLINNHWLNFSKFKEAEYNIIDYKEVLIKSKYIKELIKETMNTSSFRISYNKSELIKAGFTEEELKNISDPIIYTPDTLEKDIEDFSKNPHSFNDKYCIVDCLGSTNFKRMKKNNFEFYQQNLCVFVTYSYDMRFRNSTYNKIYLGKLLSKEPEFNDYGVKNESIQFECYDLYDKESRYESTYSNIRNYNITMANNDFFIGFINNKFKDLVIAMATEIRKKIRKEKKIDDDSIMRL